MYVYLYVYIYMYLYISYIIECIRAILLISACTAIMHVMNFHLQNHCSSDLKAMASERDGVPMEYPQNIVLGCGRQMVVNNQFSCL